MSKVLIEAQGKFDGFYYTPRVILLLNASIIKHINPIWVIAQKMCLSWARFRAFFDNAVALIVELDIVDHFEGGI